MRSCTPREIEEAREFANGPSRAERAIERWFVRIFWIAVGMATANGVSLLLPVLK